MTNSYSRGNAVHFRAGRSAGFRAGSEVLIVGAGRVGDAGIDF